MMFKKVLGSVLLLCLLLVPAALADKPTVAVLTFGIGDPITYTEQGVFDVLQSYGFVNAGERTQIAESAEFEGEHINVIRRNAYFDFATANLLLSEVLEADPQMLITLTTPMTKLAINVTSTMENPPVVLFTAVFNPFEIGIADAPCLKPAHVTGTESLTPYEELIALLQLQVPTLQTLGVIHSSTEDTSLFGAKRIVEMGEALGLTVKDIAVNSFADLRPATQKLIDYGAEALLLPLDSVTGIGLPIIAQLTNAQSIPIFYPHGTMAELGATISLGAIQYYTRGEVLGLILAAHLNGEIDIARTRIYIQSDIGLSVNLDAAKVQGIEIAPQVMAQAVEAIENGEITILDENFQQSIDQIGIVRELAERSPADQEFLASLHCTEEIIAEQQAARAAAGG